MANRKTRYAEILAALKSKPGTWAFIDSSPKMTNLANKLRVDYGMEVATRHINGNNYGVWARWPSNKQKVTTAANKIVTATTKPERLTWGEPPARGRGGKQPLFDYDTIVEKLKGKPGEWLYVGVVDVNGRVSAGISLRAQGRNCEVVTRRIHGTNNYKVWARLPKNLASSQTKGAAVKSDPNDEWGDPPVRSTNNTPVTFNYVGVAKKLFDNQDKWGKIWEGNKKSSESISRWFTGKGFETATRTLVDSDGEKTFGVWALCPSSKNRTIKRNVETLMANASTTLSKSDTKVKWQNPPDARENVLGKYDKVVKQLKAKPGKWAFIGEYHRNEFTSVYHGVVRNGCRATTRVMSDGDMRGIWAMWPPEEP